MIRPLSLPSTETDGSHTTVFDGTTLSIKGRATYPCLSAFLPMAVLLATRRGGGSISVRRGLGATQLARLNCEFVPFVADFFNGTECAVVTESFDENPVTGTQSALMFSAGVDSFYTLKKLQSMKIEPSLFLNIHAGAHADNTGAWVRRIENITHVANALDLQVETVETNFHRVFPEPHIKCHTIRNLAAAAAVQGLGTIYYSSAYKLTDLSYAKAKEHAIAYIDPVILRSFLPAGMEAVYVGADVNRIEKTRAISDFPMAFDHLDVCTNQPYQAEREETQSLNCGGCKKCIRTQVELEVCDALHRFAKVFDIPKWRQRRAAAIEELAKSNDPIDQNAVRLIGTKRSRIEKIFPAFGWPDTRKLALKFRRGK